MSSPCNCKDTSPTASTSLTEGLLGPGGGAFLPGSGCSAWWVGRQELEAENKSRLTATKGRLDWFRLIDVYKEGVAWFLLTKLDRIASVC